MNDLAAAPRHYDVVYEVFVDRYDPGGNIPPVPQRAAAEGTVRRAFGAAPDSPGRGLDLQGGTLFGVAARLDHIAAFADALYLTPVTRAPSNHKYDVADFQEIDEHFGGELALDQLIAAARQRQIALFLDMVFNHVGERHTWAGQPGLTRGTRWRGFGHLHELDLSHPVVHERLLGAAGIVASLVRRGVSGMRLDCANDLGREHCSEIAAAIARAGGAGGAIGEVMSWPAHLVGPGALDGAMNYWLRTAILSALTDEADIGACARSLDRLAASVPAAWLLRSWTVLSTHDTPRLSTAVGLDEAKARLCLALQFAYPGTPLLYYGEEIGMVGGTDPDCRAAMIWDEAQWQGPRLALVRRLCELRRTLPALRSGRYVPLDAHRGLVAFARTTGRVEETLIFVCNPGSRTIETELLLPLGGFYDALPVEDLLDHSRHQVQGGSLRLSLPPRAARWLVPRDDDPGGYRFWKTPTRCDLTNEPSG